MIKYLCIFVKSIYAIKDNLFSYPRRLSMAANNPKFYTLTGLARGAPTPVVAERAPGVNDRAYALGTIWVNKDDNSIYMLANFDASGAVWTTSPASGVGTFTSVTIDPGDLDMTAGGEVLLGSGPAHSDVTHIGDYGLTGNFTQVGNMDITGDVTVTGDFDLSDTGSISLTSTNDAADAIYLHANGGTSETIRLHSDQGTGVGSVTLESDVGGISLLAPGLASADAINITATLGGIDMDSALLTSITSTRNNPQAILLEATLGGIDILASGAAAGEDIDIIATGSSVNINSTESAADSIVISSTNGGIDILATGAAAGEDIDIVATGSSVNITSTENDAGAIYIRANGGITERVRLHADQGTGVDSVLLLSDVGGITLTATGLASADAINLEATAGGIDMDSALLMSLTSTRNDPQAILIEATLGGIDILASGGAAGEDIDIIATGSSVNINSTENVADSIVISSTNGGIDISALGAAAGEDIDITATGSSVNITSTENVADSIVISSTNGGIDITVAGGAAGEDIDITATGSSVNITATEDDPGAIFIHANGGVTERILIHADQGTAVDSVSLLSDVGGITIRSTGLASADGINLESAAGGIDMDSALLMSLTSTRDNAQAILIEATLGGIDIIASGAAAGEDIDITATGSSVNITATEDNNGAIYVHANGGTSERIQLHADQGTAVDSISLLSDVGGITIQATGLASADGINLTATAGGIDMDSALLTSITSTRNDPQAILLEATLGGIDILASGAGAGEDIDIIATGSSVNITSTEAISSAIVLTSSNAAGGIQLTTGGGAIALSSSGIVTMTPGTSSAASPGTNVTINARVGVATFTGFTTASGAEQLFTVTNSYATTTSGVIATAYQNGANDAQLSVAVKSVAGTLTFDVFNDGAAAVNGDIIITFWIIN